MDLFRKPLKISGFLILVITFLPISFLVDLFVSGEAKKLRYFSRISSFYMRVALKVLGVRVRIKNADKLYDRKNNYFIISNHLSYIDIFAISSAAPAVFVANSDLEEAFLLGTIVRYSGGVFVERRNRGKILGDMQAISDMLDMGLNVVIFPEGTTSNGDRVMPFKSSLLAASAQSGVEVLPLCIRYRKINGEDVDGGNGHLVYYYGSISFFEHFFRFLNLRSVTVELTELESIGAEDGFSRKELTKAAYERISAAYNENRREGGK